MSHSFSVIAEFRFVALVQLCAAVTWRDGYTTSGGLRGALHFLRFVISWVRARLLQSPADSAGVFGCHAHFEYVDTSSRKLLLRSSIRFIVSLSVFILHGSYKVIYFSFFVDLFQDSQHSSKTGDEKFPRYAVSFGVDRIGFGRSVNVFMIIAMAD